MVKIKFYYIICLLLRCRNSTLSWTLLLCFGNLCPRTECLRTFGTFTFNCLIAACLELAGCSRCCLELACFLRLFLISLSFSGFTPRHFDINYFSNAFSYHSIDIRIYLDYWVSFWDHYEVAAYHWHLQFKKISRHSFACCCHEYPFRSQEEQLNSSWNR